MARETFSCVNLSNMSDDDELKIAWKELIESTKKVASQKVWQTIVTKEKRPMENQEFILCQRCVVENPDNELPQQESNLQ